MHRHIYLSVVCGGGAEQSLDRKVARDDEASHVDEELAGDVEENEEEVQGANTKDGVHLGHRGLLLKVVENRVLGKLRASCQRESQ